MRQLNHGDHENEPSAGDFQQGEYIISTNQAKLDLDVIHQYLTNSYWAAGITRGKIEQIIPNSFCFGLYKQEKQIGFARAITDFHTIAYLADVFVLEAFQKKGLGKWLIKTIIAHPDLQNLRKWVLMTDDAQGLYAHFGFQPLDARRTCMELRNNQEE